MPEAIIFDDTVKAKIIPVDLYPLIQPVKEAHFKTYGRVWDHDYEKKMTALKEGKPQQRLEEDRIAREVVRAILASDCWVVLEGKESPIHCYGATVFPDIPNDDITNKVYGLMNEDGLLDFSIGGCCGPGKWCFESEIVYYRKKNDEKIKLAKYDANLQLREAIRAMLKPFEAEKALYVLEV